MTCFSNAERYFRILHSLINLLHKKRLKIATDRERGSRKNVTKTIIVRNHKESDKKVS